VLAAAAPTTAAADFAGYDGSNPFDCTIQDVGFGTDYPQPDADPFCVEFDKTRQNVTELGLVDFLAQEPTRVAAASNKCFYWQTDHWRGSIVQSDGRTETYGYDGSYFFDKARGAGGAHVENFRLLGQSGDPTTVPGFPDEWRPFFGKGRGGVMETGRVQAEPRCVDMAESKPVYRPVAAPRRCRLGGGRVGRGIGGIAVRVRRARVRREVGAPTRETPRSVRYCLEGGGTLSAAFRARGDRRRVALVKVDDPAFRYRALSPGVPVKRARRTMKRERVRRRRDGGRLLIARGKRRTLVAMARGGRVRFVAVAPARVSLSTLGRDLRALR